MTNTMLTPQNQWHRQGGSQGSQGHPDTIAGPPTSTAQPITSSDMFLHPTFLVGPTTEPATNRPAMFGWSSLHAFLIILSPKTYSPSPERCQTITLTELCIHRERWHHCEAFVYLYLSFSKRTIKTRRALT